MMILRKLFLFFFACSFVVTVNAQTAKFKSDAGRKYDYFFHNAVSKRLDKKFGESFNLLNHCISICPERSEAYFERAQILNEILNTEAAYRDIKKAYTLNKTQKEYKKSLLYQCLFLQKVDEAVSLGEEICATSNNPEVLNILLTLYNSKNDFDNSLRILDKIEEISGANEDITLGKMQIFEKRGEKNRAYLELKKLSDSDPRNTDYKLMLGNWLLQNNKGDEAYKIYLEVLAVDPNDVNANFSLLDYYIGKGKTAETEKLTEQLLLNEEIPSSSKLVLMQQYVHTNENTGGDSTKVLAVFDKVLSLPDADAEMAELKAAYMSMKKMPSDSVIEAFKFTLEKDPTRLSSRLQLLQEYWNKKDYKNVIKYSEPTEGYEPNDVTISYFLSLAYIMEDKEEKAMSAVLNGLKYVDSESNPIIVSELYNIAGDMYHAKGESEKAFAAYDSCLVYNGNNVACLNNYAYFLSIEGGDLDKAETMSRKTVVAEPNNNTYLDTYAWILFLKKRYVEALTYMERMLDNSKEENMGADVYEHAGDIYSLCGNKEKALLYWKKAKSDGSQSKTIDKKIKKGIYVPEEKK